MPSPSPQTPPENANKAQEVRRNWAGWYPDGDDLIFEQTSYDRRMPALSGLAGFSASLSVLLWLLAQGLPGDPIRNGLYGALLLVNIVALLACGVGARLVLRPIHRIARFSCLKQALIVRDVLALGLKREHRYAYPQLGEARLRTERVLSAPENTPKQEERDHLLAYPVLHIDIARLDGLPPFTLTTGALLSPHAAQRAINTLNAHLAVARKPLAPPPPPATPPVIAPRAVGSASATRRATRRAIPPRPIR